MRVGIFRTSLQPEVGGGYTIQEDIYQSLIECADESRHTFVLLSPPGSAQSATTEITSKRVQLVDCPTPHLVDWAVNKGIRESQTFRLAWSRPTWLDRVARRWDIEFMWFFDSVLPLVINGAASEAVTVALVLILLLIKPKGFFGHEA